MNGNYCAEEIILKYLTDRSKTHFQWMIFVSTQEEDFNHGYSVLIRARGTQVNEIQIYTKRDRGEEEQKSPDNDSSTDGSSVWKSKHFKMKSSND